MKMRDLIERAISARVAADARHEASLPAAMRFGNSGAIINGKVYGDCARLAHLRLQGFQPAKSRSTQIIFAAGRAMEEIVNDFLTMVVPKGRLLREEEAAVSYQSQGGLPITGRPDFIILGEDGKPTTGVENKGKMSYFGVKNLLLEDKYETSHLIQGAHYMWAYGLESYALVYVLPVKYPAPKGTERLWPKGTIEGDYVKQITPNIFVLEMSTAKDGSLLIEDLKGKQRPTKLKKEHITDFYTAVEQMGEGRPLPPMPTSTSLIGKATYKKCSYCKLKPACDTFTKYDRWYDRAVDIITDSWQEIWPEHFDNFMSGWEKDK